MKNVPASLIADVHYVARGFLQQHYPGELATFEIMFDALRKAMASTKGRLPDMSRLLSDVQLGLGFARPVASDDVPWIVTQTVWKLFDRTKGQRLSSHELSRMVSQVAVESHAAGELLAVLIRRLPELHDEARAARLSAAEAIISEAPKAQYEIWTGGKHKIVDSIEEYERKKDAYVFWIDWDEGIQLSLGKPPHKLLQKKALALLLYLAKGLGGRVQTRDILKEVFADDLKQDEPVDDLRINRIQQQLTALHNFSGEQFRQHLFDVDFERGVGLEASFKDKYFVLTRLR